MRVNNISKNIIGAAIEVHKVLGPGLLESAYEECLCRELALRGVQYTRQLSIPIEYKNTKIDCGYRLDVLVEDSIVVEIKVVDKLTKIHEAQLLTYLRLGGWRVGLLVNFNELRLVDGIKRKVLNFDELA